MTTVTERTTTTDLTTEVASVLAAMRDAEAALPLDIDLSTPRQVEANVVRRNLLSATSSRLGIDFQRLQESESQLPVCEEWIATLREARTDLESRLATAEDTERDSGRRLRSTEMLRHSLRDVMNGPEVVTGKEFTTDILVQRFRDHHVHPMTGASGIFDGRGGLRSAERRLAELTLRIREAREEVERTLTSAQQLV